jgi:nucleotide-binding universal stress UspA family protein
VRGYLEQILLQCKDVGLNVESAIQEGPPAECIVNFANSHNVDLIVLSTHGSSGLSSWNVSSVVQKIILRANKSILLIRAYDYSAAKTDPFLYRRLFIGLDCSARAELVLPVAIRLATSYNAELVLGTVVQKPNLFTRLPLSDEDVAMIEHISERNQSAASHYLEQLHVQLSQSGIGAKTRLVVDNNLIAALHNLVEKEEVDMVMLVAHGHSGMGRWLYGSVATSFIEYGTTSLLIMQDLAEEDLQTTKAEMAIQETQGH